MGFINHLSCTSLRLELLKGELSLSSATGSIWRQGSACVLVTNWHVLAGRSNVTGQPSHSMGAIPTVVSVPIKRTDTYVWDRHLIELYHPNGTASWRQHPRGQDVDLAYVPLRAGTVCDDATVLPLSSNCDQLALIAGQEAFVLGFPFGMTKQGELPIWKRASVASEPEQSVDGEDLILIDTATRKGMSGAPVFLWQLGTQMIEDRPGHISTHAGGAKERFLGIYSGRYGAEDELGAQLGRVWKASLVAEMLSANVAGAHELRDSR